MKKLKAITYSMKAVHGVKKQKSKHATVSNREYLII